MKRRGSVYDMQRDVFICLQDAIKLAPTATLSELRCMINTDVSLATVHRYVRHLGYSRKRVSSTLMGSPSVDSVERFNQLHSSFVAREALIVSVDECHFSTRLFPRYGYSPVGDPCPLRRKLRVRGDGRSISLIMAICSDGSLSTRCIHGSVNRNIFRSWVSECNLPRNSVLLLDNCSIHHGNDTEFSPLYLPPYSPQLQPVELAFSKIKRHFRSLWPYPHGVVSAIEQSVATVTSSDVLGFFRHAERCRTAVSF